MSNDQHTPILESISRLRGRARAQDASRLGAAREGSGDAPALGSREEDALGQAATADVIGGRIHHARHAAGLSIADLARMLDVSVWKMERLEAGEEDAGPYLHAIAGVTRRPPESLSGSAALGVRSPPTAAPDARELVGGGVTTAHGARMARTLVLGAITLLVTIRVFTELVPILPRAANFVDVPIFVALILAGLAQRRRAEQTTQLATPLAIACLFVLLCAVSTMTNLTRVDLGPALMFVYGFLGPLGVYFAAYRLWPAGAAIWMSKLLLGLVILQLVLAFGVQLPQYIATGNPDLISGTFGENAYQLIFFLLVVLGLLLGIFTFEKHRPVVKVIPLMVLAILAVVFLAQYRSLLVTMALTILMLAALLTVTRARGAAIAGCVVAGLLVSLVYVVQNVPALKFDSAVELSRQDPTLLVEKRLGPARIVDQMFREEPRFTFTGTGPGTYSSRGWQTFARAGDATSTSNVAGDYVQWLTGGRTYRTDVSDKYVLPQIRDAEVVDGSRALTNPFSSYLAVLAEIGVLGLVLILALYGWALLRSVRMTLVSLRAAADRDPLPALLCATAVAFFVLPQMAIFENWLEVSRITFLSWILLAVTTKEFDARGLRA